MRLMSAALLCSACVVSPVWAAQTVSHGRFEHVPVALPDGPVQRVVMWFHDGNNAKARAARVAALRADGAMVIDVDSHSVARAVDADGGSCGFSPGDVENFSRFVQAYYKVPTYSLPILGGDGAGAGLVYAVAAQSDPQVIAGVVTDGFCPQLAFPKLLCGAGVHGAKALVPAPVVAPWLLAATPAHGQCPAASVAPFVEQVPLARTFKRTTAGDALPGVRAAVRVLGDQRGIRVPAAPKDLTGLPTVEVPANGAGDTFAIFLSGDGGWAGLDKEVAGALAQAGMPVVGVDSLRYFWSKRTPQGLAQDLDRIARYYAAHWQRHKVVLVGFSQGADVLPAAINQLPPSTRAMLDASVLLSLGRSADYEFHVTNWLGSSSDSGLPIAPEMAKLDPRSTVCVYGRDDDDALCPSLPASGAKRVALPGDHHFDGDYARLAQVVLEAAGVSGAGAGPAK